MSEVALYSVVDLVLEYPCAFRSSRFFELPT